MLRFLPAERWDETHAAHLLNRAGFGGPPEEIQRLAALGRDGAVAHLLDYERMAEEAGTPDWARPDPTRLERFEAARKASEEERNALRRQEQREQRQRFVELQGWWLERMATTPRPLQEKLTLFWHGHFATSFVKVRDAYLMWLQNDLFRRHACGSWLDLLVAVARDPAMLLWLDQAQSRKQHPNENFARELMELFTLGEGHYTEQDVAEAARAFTGWGYDRLRQQFLWRPTQHDDTAKTVLGVGGPLDGNDVITAILAKPEADRFITSKLWTFFAGQPPSPELNEALAQRFRESGQTFKPLLRAIFLSEEFYAPGVVRNQVKSPVQWLVGSVRMLQRPLPPPAVSSRLTKELGQELFAPPNVKGWDGGVSWITTNHLLTRYNQAALLVYGGPAYARQMATKEGERRDRPVLNRLARARGGRLDLDHILTPEEKANPDALIAALESRLLQSRLSPDQQAALRDFLSARGELDEDDLLGAIHLVMATPDFQLT